MKWPDLLRACIRLEVLQDHVVDDQAGFGLFDQGYMGNDMAYLVAFGWVRVWR